jgi:hypothetical protein
MPDDIKTRKAICEAIDARCLLVIALTSGGAVTVEPHIFGLGVDGHSRLLAWCVATMATTATTADGWMLCRLDQMRDVRILVQTFVGPRPGYRRVNAQIRTVLCWL